ncbi:MAG: hypothetical protein Q9215_006366 [Flavoplaca cf. flavocitrina]
MDQEKQSHVSETEILSVEERDVLALARLGKKPILKFQGTDDFGNFGDNNFTGWLVICGWQAILAGSAYLGGNMIITLARLNHASYEPALWQGTLVYWCVMAVAILVNMYASKILPKLESFTLVLHIGGFFAVLVPLVVVCIRFLRMRGLLAVGRKKRKG